MGRKEETKFATEIILNELQNNLSPVRWSDEESSAEGLQADIFGGTERSEWPPLACLA